MHCCFLVAEVRAVHSVSREGTACSLHLTALSLNSKRVFKAPANSALLRALAKG